MPELYSILYSAAYLQTCKYIIASNGDEKENLMKIANLHMHYESKGQLGFIMIQNISNSSEIVRKLLPLEDY